MAEHPAHTPYDGSSRPFSVGLRPLDPGSWLEVDENFDAYMAEKRRLYASVPQLVFVAEADTAAAQQEVLDLVRAHLDQRRTAAQPQGADAPLAPNLAGQPLHTASLLVQEDLILMRASPEGWRLAAGSLCFPSHWSLTEKFGRPLAAIHAPVPGFGPGTRFAELIQRMFDNLRVDQPVERYNWSIQSGGELYRPLSNQGRIDRAVDRPSRFPGGDIDAHAFIRVERQTLRKLPRSGDILFTIRICLDPLRVLERHPDRWRLAHGFADQLQGMDGAQLDYKGLAADRDALVQRLREMGGASAAACGGDLLEVPVPDA